MVKPDRTIVCSIYGRSRQNSIVKPDKIAM